MRHELGHHMMNTLFPPQSQALKRPNSFSVDIDDCECELCSDRREFLLPYTTIEITIVVGGNVVTQRLTPNEAREAANWLNEYAEIVESLNAEHSESEDPMEEYI